MWRFEGGRFQEEAYSLPEEERFLLLVNGKPWASFSYTPGDEVYLALGHLFLSGHRHTAWGVEAVACWTHVGRQG